MSDHKETLPKLPRWSLDSIYPGFEAAEYSAAKKRLSAVAAELLTHLEALPSGATGTTSASGTLDANSATGANSAPDITAFRAWLSRALKLNNEADLLGRTLGSFCNAIYTTDTGDKRAMNELNSVEEILLPFAKADVLFLNALAANADAVRALIACDPEIGRYSFYLEDALFWQTRRMSAAEEDLAADLARCGADAWGRLQEQLTSSSSCLWDEKSGERKTLVELRSLAYDPSREVREKAYRKELEICKSIEIGVAAALNGVKGTAVSLNSRRKWSGGALEKSVRQSRMSEKTLAALIGAMEESLPYWRRYLKAKAALIGVPACAFYDIFAPVGGAVPAYSWEQARALVVENFTAFSPAMGEFARRAFDNRWIDAEPRAGKIGGAYCTDMPLQGETRVLCNFDGTFNSVITVAHELGHAYHSDVLMGLPALQQNYPMTLAETASTFAETVVFQAGMQRASDAERLGLLEMHLQDGCQILVDILSRYYFEQSVMAERVTGELTPGDFCARMKAAQERTYGDGLDSGQLHPWMWLVKTHYYSADLAFYNYPYAFGQLFALALYARYRAEGPAFAETYRALLLETGRMDSVELTAKAGFDIESIEFWRSGIALFTAQIEEFEKLVQMRSDAK